MIEIQIINDTTGTDEIGNYAFWVLVNNSLIDEGEIKGHNREDSWQKLLKLLIEQNPEKDEK